jgi:hypothetical protein
MVRACEVSPGHDEILQMGTDKMIPRHVFHKPLTVRFPDRSKREEVYTY